MFSANLSSFLQMRCLNKFESKYSHVRISTDCKVKEVQSDIARFWYATDSMVSHEFWFASNNNGWV